VTLDKAALTWALKYWYGALTDDETRRYLELIGEPPEYFWPWEVEHICQDRKRLGMPPLTLDKWRSQRPPRPRKVLNQTRAAGEAENSP
jgi:hypothetical protein